jgi:cytosine/adenosine deaminase-related metal-dependent hydrolase
MPASRYFRSKWLLPIHRSPVENGWVQTCAGRIVDVGRGTPPGPATDLGAVALLPGLVNAHTHVELSWMAGKVPPAGSMHEWIAALMQVRRTGVPAGAAAELTAARKAAETMRATGTVLVGDVSNTLTTLPVFPRASLGAVVFHELLGFSAAEPEAVVRDAWRRVDEASAAMDGSVAFSVVAHAPYSVSPALFSAIAGRARTAPLSIHLAESAEEVEFLRTGRGPIREMLESLGVWVPAWRAPGCDPVQYIESLGYLRPGVLVVHGVHLTPDALERLREAKAVLVTCPRSNTWVGAGAPRLAHFYASGVPVAVGTDSLASAASLNLFDELSEIRRLAPEVAAASILDSATRVGAQALGFGRDFGTLSAGKRAAFVAVDVPSDVVDVEEYLVGGVPSSSVRPLAG